MSDDAMRAERDFNESNIEEFRRIGGKVGGQFEGFPLLLLTSTGARSGAQRDSVYPIIVVRAPGFGEYQQRTDRVIPVFELALDRSHRPHRVRQCRARANPVRRRPVRSTMRCTGARRGQLPGPRGGETR